MVGGSLQPIFFARSTFASQAALGAMTPGPGLKGTPDTMSWQSALERTVTGMGYDLVDVERSAGGLLRVTIDRLPGQTYGTGPGDFVLVEDCELVTRQLQYLLEVEALEYARLEVSSPGLDRPLKKPADWPRFVGQDVEITLREPFQNRRKWQGQLAAAADGAPEGHWRLVLPAVLPQPAKKGARVSAKALAEAAAQPAQTLDFSLDEVREARLVPHVDFKGRRGTGRAEASAAAADEPQAAQVDGGQD